MYHPPSIHEKERFTVLPYKHLKTYYFYIFLGAIWRVKRYTNILQKGRRPGQKLVASVWIRQTKWWISSAEMGDRRSMVCAASTVDFGRRKLWRKKSVSVSEAEKSSAKVIFGHLIFKLLTSNLEDTGWKDPVFRVFQWNGLGLGQICVVFGI